MTHTFTDVTAAKDYYEQRLKKSRVISWILGGVAAVSVLGGVGYNFFQNEKIAHDFNEFKSKYTTLDSNHKLLQGHYTNDSTACVKAISNAAETISAQQASYDSLVAATANKPVFFGSRAAGARRQSTTPKAPQPATFPEAANAPEQQPFVPPVMPWANQNPADQGGLPFDISDYLLPRDTTNPIVIIEETELKGITPEGDTVDYHSGTDINDADNGVNYSKIWSGRTGHLTTKAVGQNLNELRKAKESLAVTNARANRFDQFNKDNDKENTYTAKAETYETIVADLEAKHDSLIAAQPPLPEAAQEQWDKNKQIIADRIQKIEERYDDNASDNDDQGGDNEDDAEKLKKMPKEQRKWFKKMRTVNKEKGGLEADVNLLRNNGKDDQADKLDEEVAKLQEKYDDYEEKFNNAAKPEEETDQSEKEPKQLSEKAQDNLARGIANNQEKVDKFATRFAHHEENGHVRKAVKAFKKERKFKNRQEKKQKKLDNAGQAAVTPAEQAAAFAVNTVQMTQPVASVVEAPTVKEAAAEMTRPAAASYWSSNSTSGYSYSYSMAA